MSCLPFSNVASEQSQSHQASRAGGRNLENVSLRATPPVLKCMKTSFQSFPRFINEFLFPLHMIRPPSPLASSFPLNDVLCLYVLCPLVRARWQSWPSSISVELKRPLQGFPASASSESKDVVTSSESRLTFGEGRRCSPCKWGIIYGCRGELLSAEHSAHPRQMHNLPSPPAECWLGFLCCHDSKHLSNDECDVLH